MSINQWVSVLLITIAIGGGRDAVSGECELNLLAEHYHDVFSYPDSQLIVDLLAKTGGALIDFGCATGRALEIGAKCGIESIGIDDSIEMIKAGSSRIQDSKIRFIHGRYEEEIPDLYGKAGLIVIAANTYLMMLDQESRHKTLKVARKYLKPGGRLFIYVRSNITFPEIERSLNVRLQDGNELKFHIRWKEQANHRTFTLDFVKANVTDQYIFETAKVPLGNLLTEFADVGWSIEEMYGDFNKGPMAPNSVHWFFVLKEASE